MRRPIIALAVLVGCGAPTVGDDASPRMSAQAFDTLTDGVARRNERTVAASGEAMLGDDGVAHRWARLDPDDPGRARGAYVLEAGSDAWIITYETDGRTEAWTGVSTDRAIEHTQEHHHGHETIVFALRGGVPVVLDYELLEDTETGEQVTQHFARDGVCVKTCPPLAGFRTVDARIHVERAE
jgi:hypothetical protein